MGTLLCGAAGLALVTWSGAASADTGQQQAPEVPARTPEAASPVAVPRNSAGTQLVLPLSSTGQLYGDLLAEVYLDGRIRYSRSSLVDAMAPLLAEAGKAQFAAALPPQPFVSTEDVAQAGVALRYDASKLEVVVERIEPTMMAVQVVGGSRDYRDVAVTVEPEDFSAYINLVGDLRVSDFKSFEDPALLISGAARYHGFVAEFDGGYDPSIAGSGIGFYRRSARLVYDQPEKSRRWSAGDLQLNGLPITAGTLLGGVAVEKGRRVFTGLAPLTPLGNQQILLDRDATIEVIVDGQQVQTLQLAAGPYDLSQLRAQYGARDAQLFITDITGRRQLTSIDPFFNPADLLKGEDEYSAAIGLIPTNFSFQPEYGGGPAFAGYYRRGMTNRLILGGTLQVSQDMQVAGAEIIVSPRGLPGRFQASAAANTGDSAGIALLGGYALQTGVGRHARQFSINAEYRSRGFATITDFISDNRFATLNVNAAFSQSLSDRTAIVSGLSWFEREGFKTTRTAYVDVIHRARRFRLVAGVEYGTGLFGRNFGVRLGVTVPFGKRSRAEANYNSRRDDFRAFVARSYEDSVGSYGYDVGFTRSANDARLDGILNYVGNRFYSRLSLATGGNGLSGIGDSQDARLQIGTALAYAGGSFAIGRPIDDSFVIAGPHESLSDQQVVLARSVSDDRYIATSGALGPALGGRLNSYTPQTIIYDFKNGAQGYDIGSGIERVEPPYRSGYRLVVGSNANITAYGFLRLPTGVASLVSGTITSPDDPDFGTQPFFTNSVGRFAIIGLEPGKTYELRLANPNATYRIMVPQDSESLLRLDELTLVPVPETGQE